TNDGGGIIEAEIHLAERPKLFRQPSHLYLAERCQPQTGDTAWPRRRVRVRRTPQTFRVQMEHAADPEFRRKNPYLRQDTFSRLDHILEWDHRIEKTPAA
ncbi:hypothetical protein, partial [Shinella granuli]|uniref:hypothetical protein n=1 Tax=Shinella granuli TaxID=323621 RepID=UPI0031EF9154